MVNFKGTEKFSTLINFNYFKTSLTLAALPTLSLK